MTTARPGTAPGDYRAGLLDALRTIEQLRGRIEELDSGARALAEPVAVVGLSCRLPGGAQDPEAYWRMLGDGVDATGEFPAERADARALYDPDPDAPGKAYTIRGGFLGRVDRFEPAVFGISPREALGMDPQQRLALEVAWEALERAGYAPDALDGSSTGVYLGVSTTDYVRLRQAHGSAADVDAYQLIGEPSFVAGRISYTLGLRGPSKVLDTTCSSSLVAVHEACQALRLGECDMALAGGVNLILAPYGFLLMSKMRALAPDGRCKTFDAAADGYARGEGAGVVVLKRLSDAIRDRDHIAAVLRGSAVNHDGRSSGLTVPNPAAQQQVINGALAQAGIAPGDVDYVEAHGTGTALGDPIELRALQAALARHRTDGEPLLVGSVKTNIGHLESAAGVAGLIKLVLALQHGRIPAHLHFTTPNPNVDWARLGIRVTAEPQKWPERGRERIGAISGFGSSGTNAHAVVSSAPEPVSEPAPAGAPYGLLLASARTPEALRETAERYARELRRRPESALADVCWTTQVGRARQQYGLAVVGDGLGSLTEALERYARGEHDPRLTAATLPAYKYRRTAWLFTGQGAQYPGMGRDLLGEPAFRAAFEECERLIDPLLGRPLREVLWPPAAQAPHPAPQASHTEDRPIDNTRYAQPALFAVEYALARMWLAWGVRPGALLGHSVGEIAAACVAGVFGLADACRLVVARADLMAALPPGGAMAAVACSEATARAALAGRTARLAVAAVNGPTETVLSGDAAELTAVLAELAAQGVRGRRLAVSHAFHSPLLEPMLKEFRAVAEEITYAAPALPLISDVTGRPWGPAEIGPDYWVRHAASPVRFHDGLTTLYAEGYRTYLEIGPAPVLSGLGDRATDDPDCVWIPSLLPPASGVRSDGGGRPEADGRSDAAARPDAAGRLEAAARPAPAARPDTDGRATVRRALGLLRLRGADPDWSAVQADARPRRVPLPTTPWRGESYWFAERGEGAATGTGPDSGTDPVPGGEVPGREMSGRDVPGVGRRLRTAVPTYELDPRWAAPAGDGDGHLPLGVLADIAVSAAADALGGTWACVEEIELLEGLPPAHEPYTLQLTIGQGIDGRAEFALRALTRTEEEAGAPWRLPARGVLRHHPAPTRNAPTPLDGRQGGDSTPGRQGPTGTVEYGALTGAGEDEGAGGTGGHGALTGAGVHAGAGGTGEDQGVGGAGVREVPSGTGERGGAGGTGDHEASTGVGEREAPTGAREHQDPGGRGGALVALDPSPDGGTGLAAVLDAAVSALIRDADRDHPGAAWSATLVRQFTCPDPALVRYVRAAARPQPAPGGPTDDARPGAVQMAGDEAAGPMQTGGSAETSGSAEADARTAASGPVPMSGAVDFFAGDGRHLGGIGELRVAPAGPPRPAAWQRSEELLSRVEWQPSPLPAAPRSLAGQSWLLLPDRGGAAARLAAQLRDRGAHCLLADPEPAGNDPAAVGALLTRWRTEAERKAGDGAALRVVVCTALDAPLLEEAEVGLIEEYRDRTELTAVTVVQRLLAAARPGERVPVSLVTRGTQAAGPAHPVDPFGAALWGLGRVLALEHPEFWGGAVDLGPLPEGGGEDGAEEASLLLAALTDSGEDQQALRGADRYVARLVPHPPTAEEQRAPVLRSGATYLVTGAFGGIGQAVSRWLASAGADRLVLLGRTPLPDRADRDAPGLSPATRGRLKLVRDLEAMGVDVEVAVADVADPAAMRRVVAELSADGRPLRGVVHTAGVQVPQFLRDIPVADPGDYDAVWRPKVIGGWLLHQLTDGLDLNFFVNFSSVAATWGSQHLTAYAAANAFLDALAEHRHAGGLRALTVSWGPWDLPSNLFGEDVLAFLTATGLRTLSAPQCLRLLGGLLAGTAPNAVVCAADWSVYKPVMEARGERPLLRTVELPEEEGGPGAGPLLDGLATAGRPADRLALLVPYLRQVLGEVLAVSADTLLPESDVFAHGLDSLMVMEVVKRCKQDLRVTLRPHQFFERTTLEDWAVLLSDATAASGTRGGGSPAPLAAPATVATWTDPARIAEDVTLDPAIRPGTPLPTGYTAPREVLLTGATGFLGAHLLDELLATTDATVYCLVRCAGPEQGLARIRENAERYLPWRPDADRRVVVLPGDLARPLLGLDEARFDALADRLDAIYHNGALVNFSHTYEQSRPANVAGTEEILRLACRGRLTPVSHVSTYGIWGLPADGRTVIAEDDPIGGAGKLVTGYVQSKWAAERLVELARERGIPVDLYRPGRVLGHSRTGACLTTHFTTRVIKGCVQLGLAPALDLEIEMTPVDYVAAALVRISREEHRFGATYHLVNRHRMRFRDLVAAMVARGWRIETVPTDTWWAALKAGFAGSDAAQDNALHPVMEVVEEFVVGGEEGIDYDAARAERALLAAGITCPPLDQALLDTYLDWLIRTGYLPDPDPSPASGR